MLKYLSLPLIILILVVGGLIYVRMTNRATTRREELRKGELAQEAVWAIENEIALQLQGGVADLFVIKTIVDDYKVATKPKNKKKEIRQ